MIHTEYAGHRKPETRGSRVIGCFDAYDPDNLAGIYAMARVMKDDVAAIIVNGRFAHPDPEAPLTSFDPEFSARELSSSTRRIAGMLGRAGMGGVRVFEGLIAPRSIIPHSEFWNDAVFDIAGDAVAETPISGDMSDAIEYLEATEGSLDVVAGGPLTEVAKLMERPELYRRLGRITMQLGMFGLSEKKPIQTFAGKRIQFNYATDPDAANKVLSDWPGPLYVIPADVTKRSDVAIPDLKTLHQLPINQEIKDIYTIAHPQLMTPYGGEIYIHDLHPVFLMADLRSEKEWKPHHPSPEYNTQWWIGNYWVEQVEEGNMRPAQGNKGELECVWGQMGEADGSNHHVVTTFQQGGVPEVLLGTKKHPGAPFPPTFFDSVVEALRLAA